MKFINQHLLTGRHLKPLLLLFSLLSLAGCRQESGTVPVSGNLEKKTAIEPGKQLRKVRFLPYWVPSAQFAGYYIGIEKGIFQKHGIELEILSFDPMITAESIIREKKTDFAVLWMVNAIEMKCNGLEIMNIAQISTRSSLMLITKKSSGIKRLEDMNGKRAGIWIGYERQPQALFRKYNLDVEIVPIGSTNNLFLLDGVDILNANWFDEYHSIINNGINEDEMNRFFFADYGLNFLEDGIYCHADLVEKDPQLCIDFTNAMLESWQYAFDHQEEAMDIVVEYAKEKNQPVNKPHQRWMLSHYKALYIPEGSQSINTGLREEDFNSVLTIMLENGVIEKTIPFDSFFKHYGKLQQAAR